MCLLLLLTGVSYKWYPSVAGLPNLYLDGWCKLKVENNCYTENTFYKKQAVCEAFRFKNVLHKTTYKMIQPITTMPSTNKYKKKE